MKQAGIYLFLVALLIGGATAWALADGALPERAGVWAAESGVVGSSRLMGVSADAASRHAFTAGERGALNDLPTSHWAYAEVARLRAQGVIDGYSDGSFRPNGLVTYGEFLKMAMSVYGRLPEALAAGGQAPSNGAHWATPYYEFWLTVCSAARDIPVGALDQPIPRRMMAFVAAGLLGEDRRVDYWGKYADFAGRIRDVDARTPYEYAIVKAYAAGVLNGYPDGSFRPDEYVTRAAAATSIGRLAEALSRLRGGGGVDGTPAGSGSANAGRGADTGAGQTGAGRGADTGAGQTEAGRGADTGAGQTGAEPAGAAESVLVEAAPGSIFPGVDYLFTMPNWSARHDQQMNRLTQKLDELLPKQAKAILRALVAFTQKPLAEGKQGLRKEYLGGRPVMMDWAGDTVRIYVFPTGYHDEYWEVKPGEVVQTFF